MVNAQKWLEDNHKNDATEIRSGKGIELEEKLTIDGYSKLTTIFLSGAKGITELEIKNCPAVTIIYTSKNQITKIVGLEGLAELKELVFGNNKVENIDVSGNPKLEVISFHGNPPNLKIDGLEKTNLFSWDSFDTFPLPNLLKQGSEEELKKIAGELGLPVEGKTIDQIKKDIKDEAEKIKKNTQKLNDKLPGLINDKGEVDDNELKKAEDNVEKGKDHQKLVDDPNNASILDTDKKKIDPNKLTEALKELEALHDVNGHPNNGNILSDGKFDQSKLDKELAKGNDYTELATKNPNLVTDGKIDQGKLDKLDGDSKEYQAIKDIMEKAGIDPKNVDEVKNAIKERDILKTIVENFFGDNYEKRLEAAKYLNQVEVNTNK